ncbi:hypothetical protein NL676_019090 [Syzygium grande]|nr:hypothetical protein NL676_019090 [Syzygium grande]
MTIHASSPAAPPLPRRLRRRAPAATPPPPPDPVGEGAGLFPRLSVQLRFRRAPFEPARLWTGGIEGFPSAPPPLPPPPAKRRLTGTTRPPRSTGKRAPSSAGVVRPSVFPVSSGPIELRAVGELWGGFAVHSGGSDGGLLRGFGALSLGSLVLRLFESMPVSKKVFQKNSECSQIGQVFNTFIRRNIYLTKRMKRRLDDDGIFCSCSPSPGSSVVCNKDCHCGMLLSSCSSGCKCGSSCINKPFQSRPMKKMKLVQTEKCGSGIVADEDIKQGGVFIDDKTCEERLWSMKHRGETNFYLCEINRDMVIDATYKGNKSRYINHSCCPNTEMQKWIIDGETRIGIFATRDIKKGEHLTYDYQFVQFGADQDCHCGAVGCRRKLGVKPSKPKMCSEAALKLVACQVAVSSPKLEGVVSRNDVYQNGCLRAENSRYIRCQRSPHSCVGELVRITRPMNERTFGIIRRFDNFSRKHSIILGICDFVTICVGCGPVEVDDAQNQLLMLPVIRVWINRSGRKHKKCVQDKNHSRFSLSLSGGSFARMLLYQLCNNSNYFGYHC